MSHITADFALQPQSLFLGGLRELPLKRILLPTVPSLLPLMMTLAFCQRPPLPSLVKRDCMSLMLLAFRAVCLDLFGNIHVDHNRLCIKKTTRTLILFR